MQNASLFSLVIQLCRHLENTHTLCMSVSPLIRFQSCPQPAEHLGKHPFHGKESYCFPHLPRPTDSTHAPHVHIDQECKQCCENEIEMRPNLKKKQNTQTVFREDSNYFYLLHNVYLIWNHGSYLVSVLASCLRNEPKTLRQTWVSVKGMCCWTERCQDFPSNGGPSLFTFSSFSGSLCSLCICSAVSFISFVSVLRSVPPGILSSSVLFSCSSKYSREMQIMLQSAGRADMDTSCRVESSRSATCIPIPCSALSPSEFRKVEEKLTSNNCVQMSSKHSFLLCQAWSNTVKLFDIQQADYFCMCWKIMCLRVVTNTYHFIFFW